jgi:hypothetical protein
VGGVTSEVHVEVQPLRDARICDIDVLMRPCHTDKILPRVKIFLTIRLDILCISKESMERQLSTIKSV